MTFNYIQRSDIWWKFVAIIQCAYTIGYWLNDVLPNPGIRRFKTKQKVAKGMGKIGMAALTTESVTINLGSMLEDSILP